MVRRVALVLGSGGLVGNAYHAGALAALSDSGWDPREADLIVGTSIGAVTAAMLRAGISAEDLFAFAVGKPMSSEGAEIME
ncbi:MAG: patatin-like phospholipase family protein, partial [Acidimicrobiales bacterium]